MTGLELLNLGASVLLPISVAIYAYSNTRMYYHKAMAETYVELIKVVAMVALSNRLGRMPTTTEIEAEIARCDSEIARVEQKKGNGAAS